MPWRRIQPGSPRLSSAQQGYGSGHQRRRLVVLARDRYICHWQFPGCAGKANTADHVVPKIEGGSDALSNLVAACTHCNSRRAAQWVNANRNLKRKGMKLRTAAGSTPTGCLADLVGP